jgi:predicted DNA-binding protein
MPFNSVENPCINTRCTRLSNKTLKQIEELSKRDNKTISTLIREILEDYITKSNNSN